MTYLKAKNDPKRYWVRDARCIAAECLALGLYQHRGATGATGSRNTGAVSAMCLTNAYRGCPREVTHSDKLAKGRRAEGLKVVG